MELKLEPFAISFAFEHEGRAANFNTIITPKVENDELTIDLKHHWEFHKVVEFGWKIKTVKVSFGCPGKSSQRNLLRTNPQTVNNSTSNEKTNEFQIGGSLGTDLGIQGGFGHSRGNTKEVLDVSFQNISDYSNQTASWIYIFRENTDISKSSYDCEQNLLLQPYEEIKVLKYLLEVKFQINGKEIPFVKDTRYSTRYPVKQQNENKSCLISIVGPPKSGKSTWINLMYAAFGADPKVDAGIVSSTTHLSVYDFINVPSQVQGTLKVIDTAGIHFDLTNPSHLSMMKKIFDGLPNQTPLHDNSWQTASVDVNNKVTHAVVVVSAKDLLIPPFWLFSWFTSGYTQVTDRISEICSLVNHLTTLLPTREFPYLILTHEDMVNPSDYNLLWDSFRKNCKLPDNRVVRIGKDCDRLNADCQGYRCAHNFSEQSMKNIKSVISSIFYFSKN